MTAMPDGRAFAAPRRLAQLSPLRALKRDERPVTLALHPFDPARIEVIAVREGETLAAIIAAAVPDPVIRAHVVVDLAGHEIPRENWHLVRAKKDAPLLVRVRAGDDPGKIIRTILQIAVIAVATWVGGGAGGAIASEFWAAAAAATVVVAGNLAINALIPPTQPGFGDGDAIPSVYALQGVRNSARPWRPMPVYFGEHRVFPPLQAQPRQEVVGDDVWLRGMLNLGPMPLDVSDIKIGETPIGDYSGVEVELRTKPTDPPHALYVGTSNDEAIGALLDGPWVSRTTEPNTTEIISIISFPRGLGAVSDKGKNYALSATVEMRYRRAGTADAWVYARATGPEANEGASGTGAGVHRDNLVGLGINLTDWEDELPPGTATGPVTWQGSEPGKPIRRLLRAAVPKAQYDVEIRRVGAPQGDDKQKFDRCEWAVLRSMSDANPMPVEGFASLAFYAKASDQLAGFIDSINLVYARRGRTLNAAIANDAGADLSTVTAADFAEERATRNGADQLLFAYQGAHTTKPYSDEQINWPSLARFWRWCDDNGFNVDWPAEGAMTRDQAARIICSACRARPIRVGGKLTIVIDGPQTDGERQLFTPRNVSGFRVRKTFPGEVHALRIPFANREQDYQPDEMFVFADGYSRDGTEPGTVKAERYELFEIPGVTEPELIWRHGRFWLYTALLQTEQYEFDVAAESIGSQPGHLTAVAHDVMLVGLGQARVKALQTNGGGDVTGIILDEAGDGLTGRFAMEAGKAYGIRWREAIDEGGSAGRISVAASLAVQTIPGPADVLQLVAPALVADAPKVGQLLAFGEFGKETAQILLRKIKRRGEFAAGIDAVAYAPARFLAEEGAVPPHVTRVTLPRTQRPPAPVLTDVSVTAEGIYVRFDVADAYENTLTGFRARWRQSPEAGSDARFERLPDLARDERVVVLPPGLPGRTYDVEVFTLGHGETVSEAPLRVLEIGADDELAPPTGCAAVGALFTGPSGAAIPGISYACDVVEDPRVELLIVEAKPAGANDDAYVAIDTAPATQPVGELRGMTPGGSFDVAFTLRSRRGVISEPRVVVAGVSVPDTLVSTDSNALSGLTREAIEAADQALADALAAAEALRIAADQALQDAIDTVRDDFEAADQALTDSVTDAHAEIDGARSTLWGAAEDLGDALAYERSRLNEEDGLTRRVQETLLAELLGSMGGLYTEMGARADETEALAFRVERTEAATDANEAAITQEAIARTDADSALAATIDAVEATAGDNTAAIAAEAIARADADSAEAAARNALAVTVGNNTTAITNEAIARADADAAEAAARSALAVTVGQNTAAIANEAIVRQTADQSLAATNDTILAELLGSMGGLYTEMGARADETEALAFRVERTEAATDANEAAIIQEAIARADADTAEAALRAALEVTVGDHTASIANNAGAIATLQGSSVFWNLLLEASGGDPAVFSLLAGQGGSEIALAATKLFFWNIVSGDRVKAMEVIDGFVNIVNELRLSSDARIYQSFGAFGALRLGKLDGVRYGAELKDAAGNEILYADDAGAARLRGQALVDNSVLTDAIAEGAVSALASTQLAVFECWLKPVSGADPIEWGTAGPTPYKTRDMYVRASVTTGVPGKPVEINVNYIQAPISEAFEWLYYIEELYRLPLGAADPAVNSATGRLRQTKLLLGNGSDWGRPNTLVTAGRPLITERTFIIKDDLPDVGDADYNAAGYDYVFVWRAEKDVAGTSGGYEGGDASRQVRSFNDGWGGFELRDIDLIIRQLKR